MNLDNLDTTNRFKLVNFLGGKCRICLEDKPEKLEIDHIYNDGANERTKYGSSEKIYGWYLLNKEKAFERLQPLCKNCHRTKHSLNGFTELIETYTGRDTREKQFNSIMMELEGIKKTPVKEELLIKKLKETGNFPDDTAIIYIKRMLHEASIYEPIPGVYNRV